MGELELVVDAKAMLGEGPCWDSNKQLLYWVDILSQAVHIYNPNTNQTKTIKTDQYVSAVVPKHSGSGTDANELILSMHHGFYRLNLETEALTKISDPEADIPTNRFNDGKCDAAGRFWAGTMNIEESSTYGALYCLEKDFTVRKVLEGITVSNGLTWDKENKTMYYIDTPTKQVAAFDFNKIDGTISNKRVVINFLGNEGFPDGMTIDEGGMLWIAHWEGAQVSRWNPHTGEKIDSISVPSPRVTSCVFGGENFDELYITTARVNMSEAGLEKYPYAGGVFRIKPGVKGLRTYRFGE